MSFDLQHELTTRLSSHDCIHLAPDIPQRKRTTAAATHAHHLPAEESILALYDDTLFGGGSDGFILTARRICWKNTLEAPQQIAYADLDPTTLSAERSALNLSGGVIQISMSEGLPAALRDLLGLLALRPAPPADSLAEQLRRLALHHLGKASPVFYTPGIPPKKLRNAREVHNKQLDPDEAVVVLYDDTVFGSAQDGFILTARRLCWKTVVVSPQSICWADLDPSGVTTESNEVFINGDPITFTGQAALVPPAAQLFREIADLVQRGGVVEAGAAPSVSIERCLYCGLRLTLDAVRCRGCGGPA
ncbi:MAG: hypothetical protein ACI8RZ_000655 [Myxococcota bacterium]|jgi:hypothetical protein